MDSIHSRSQANTAPSRSEQNHSEWLWLPFPGEQEEGSNLVKTIRHKPCPGQAPGLLFGRTTALPCLSSPCQAAVGVNSHFKVLMKAPSASKTQGGNTHSMECQVLCQTWGGGGDGTDSALWSSHSRRACWHLRAHYLQFKRGGRGEALRQRRQQ